MKQNFKGKLLYFLLTDALLAGASWVSAQCPAGYDLNSNNDDATAYYIETSTKLSI